MNGVRRLFTTGSGSSTTTATTTTTHVTAETSVGTRDGNTAWTPIRLGRQTTGRPAQKIEQQGLQHPFSFPEQTEQSSANSFLSMRQTESPDHMASPGSSKHHPTVSSSFSHSGNGVIDLSTKPTSQRSHHELIMELLASESAIECKDFQKLEPDEITTLKKVRIIGFIVNFSAFDLPALSGTIPSLIQT
jgi:hypothetical protein